MEARARQEVEAVIAPFPLVFFTFSTASYTKSSPALGVAYTFFFIPRRSSLSLVRLVVPSISRSLGCFFPSLPVSVSMSQSLFLRWTLSHPPSLSLSSSLVTYSFAYVPSYLKRTRHCDGVRAEICDNASACAIRRSGSGIASRAQSRCSQHQRYRDTHLFTRAPGTKPIQIINKRGKARTATRAGKSDSARMAPQGQRQVSSTEQSKCCQKRRG